MEGSMNVTQPSHAARLPPLLLVLSCFQVNHPNTPGSSTSILAWPVRPRYLPKAVLSTLTWLHSPRPPAAPTARASSSPFLGSRCSCLYRPRCQGRSHDFPPEAFPSSIGLRNRSFVPSRVMTLFRSHRRHAFLHPRITSLTARRAELAFITHPPGLP